MKCEFGETQFLFSVLHEITATLSPNSGWNAPYIPTQRKERDLGYDCKLTNGIRTIFLQFKIPEKLIRSNAKYWRDYGGEYYAFKVWPDSVTHQHNELVDLANKDVKHRVFYCAPAFIKQSEFSEYYEKAEIAKNSFFISCKDLPKISGDDVHNIYYTINPRYSEMRSKPIEINGMDYTEFVGNIMESEKYTSLEECIQKLSEEFRINISSANSVQEKIGLIEEYLIAEKNIHLLLF